MTTDRIKNINNFIDSILSQEEWDNDYNKRIDFLINKYIKQLTKFNYIIKDEIDSLKMGGYVKYINDMDELIWAGALYKIDSNYIYTIKDNQIIKINKFKNIIFYKNHITQQDKTRDIFITSLDKYK
uniref:Uncharacterized protein n=1 Tax=viral metagenome TaxID=1070528 RepID=A0A6C0HW06_9ZZZZ